MTDNDSGTAADEPARFLVDPCGFFDNSYTAMHRIERERMDVLQLAGLARRFAQLAGAVPRVTALAERHGVGAVEQVEDVVPLLFAHTVYKSYPLEYLARQRFDLLTGWLGSLTAVDLEAADVSGCDSIEGWLRALTEQTPLDITFSSGTSGTMSFFPWTAAELELRARVDRVGELQTFGVPPSAAQLDGAYHYVAAPSRKHRNYMAEVMTRGEPGHIHLRGARRPSADLMWLAARLRRAAAEGAASDVAIPASLLARREELVRRQAGSAESDRAWLDEVRTLQGERVAWVSYPYDIYRIAEDLLAAGDRWTFAEGSVIAALGGDKGHDLPPDGLETIARFSNARVVQGYGMTELLGLNFRCTAGRYHLQPWTVPFVLDPVSGEPRPRRGVQRGRFAFFDLAAREHWGGLVTGDDVEVDFDGQCRCGATTLHLDGRIERLTDVRRGDDKIRGAATPQAYAEALSYLAERTA